MFIHRRSLCYTSISDSDLMTFYKCIKTGLENPDSSLGCYAMTPSDYSKFGGFFDKVIRDYHGAEAGDKKHIIDWDVEGADYDVKKLGQDELSTRVRVGRNLLGFNLPGKIVLKLTFFRNPKVSLEITELNSRFRNFNPRLIIKNELTQKAIFPHPRFVACLWVLLVPFPI